MFAIRLGRLVQDFLHPSAARLGKAISAHIGITQVSVLHAGIARKQLLTSPA